MFIAVFLLAVVAKLAGGHPSKATTDQFTVVLRISGILSGISAVVTMILALRQARAPEGRRRDNLLGPNLLREDFLVNRIDEMEVIVEKITTHQVVNCHGQRGAGKSFLLAHLADVINGHRAPSADHPVPKKFAVALYFDLADAVGFEELGAQVCQETIGKRDGIWSDFVDYVKREFGNRRVLLILDNVNTPSLWPSLGTAVYRYLAGTENHKVVLGSIDPVVLDNLRIEPVPLSGLDLPAIEELVVSKGNKPNERFLHELHEQYEGLPLYVRLLTAYGGELASGKRTAVTDSVIDVQVIPELGAETRRLLSHAALFALVTRQVSVAELEQCPLANLDTEIDLAAQLSLISRTPDDEQRLIRVHDLVRDAVLRVLNEEVSEAAALLFERARQRGRMIDAAFYLMFANPVEVGADRFDEVFGEVVRSAVSSRDYAMLSNLNARAKQSRQVMGFLSDDRERHDLFCFGCASELAALGKYPEAEETLHGSSIATTRIDEHGDPTKLQQELRFLEADLIHLLNRFGEAAEIFEELGAWAASAGETPFEARCTWAQAHVLRHQGRDLDRSLALFERAAGLGEESGQLFAKAQSIVGASGIRIVTGSVPDDEERRLAEIEAEIAASMSHDGYMLRLWKGQSRLAWYRGDEERAFEIVEAAIARALTLNDRALYNLYFERGEFLRLAGRPGQAFSDFEIPLRFAEGNGDRNLVANSTLGLVLCDASTGSWKRYGSSAAARAATLNARDIALGADVNMTVQVAEQIVSMLDGRAGSPNQFRLIVF